jgi:hypothetical protein
MLGVVFAVAAVSGQGANLTFKATASVSSPT